MSRVDGVKQIEFNGRVAIVTGAGNGLGRDYALQLAARGAAVVVNDFGGTTAGTQGGREPADAVVAQIVAAGGRAVANYASVASRTAGEELVDLALVRFGRVDIVVNNAGNQRNNRFELMTDAEFDAVLDVHLKGAFYLSQPAYKVMMQQGYGRFVFTSSASGLFGNYIRANYAAAKAGLVGLMHTVAIEGERYGIAANALLPLAASRLGQAPADALWPEWEAQDPRSNPEMALVAGALTPDYVTPLLLYLCSESCQSTHALWSAVAGRYARVFIGVTKGWLAPVGRPGTPEEIAAHVPEIDDREGFFEPLSVAEELRLVLKSYSRRAEQRSW